PAFSPGPWITRGPLVGSRERWMRDDLYEQCSLHITLTTPSSVYDGARPSVSMTRLYSSSVRWCERTTSSVIGWSPGNAAGAAEELGFGMVGLLTRPVMLFDGFYHLVVVGGEIDRRIGLRRADPWQRAVVVADLELREFEAARRGNDDGASVLVDDTAV